ncbi:MAG: AAA family ATPase [Desulforegulaceae bacterium]|nr:AAA family ATPase [Desulforegulaceae bacterium]
MKKKLGLGTSSFKVIIEEKNLYVDKTKWIHKLLTTGRAYFLSRPRRFGKSLTVSTLYELFSGNKELFKSLYIEDKWEFDSYPVLTFDFNEIDTSNPENLTESLKENLLNIGKTHNIHLDKNKLLKNLFLNLLTALYEKYNENLVILVDEYDKPIIDHLAKDEIKIAIQNREILESFFGTLKGANVVDKLEFIFVTGVSRFSKVSIFSKWNNLTDITMSGEYSDFLGYSEDEIKEYFDEYLYEFCEEMGISIEECLDKLKYYYNGYRFSKKDIKVFNPISLMNCLQNKEFANYWFSTATPKFLVELIKENNYFIPDIENVKLRPSLLETFDIERLPIVPMLFQTGYLTIKDYYRERLHLSYPNQEVKKSFTENLMLDMSNNFKAINFADELGIAFMDEDFDEVKFNINAIFNEIPYPHFKNADENYFHTIIYLSLSLIGYNTLSELLNSRGRLDLALIFPDKVYVIEFKCNSSADAAINQIKEKGYAKKWENKNIRTILCGISFDSEKREVNDILFEE